jgi:hypothetical protein
MTISSSLLYSAIRTYICNQSYIISEEKNTYISSFISYMSNISTKYTNSGSITARESYHEGCRRRKRLLSQLVAIFMLEYSLTSIPSLKTLYIEVLFFSFKKSKVTIMFDGRREQYLRHQEKICHL